jgi:hypothetical protein
MNEHTMIGQPVGEVAATPPPGAISETAAIISMIERAARNPSLDLSRLEKLMEMKERVEARNARMAYSAALSAMQPTLPTVERNGRITIHEKGGAKIIQSTPYALWEDINDAIKPHLAEHGFALSFRTGTTPEGKITVTGILSHREGHQEETTMVLTHDSTGSKNAVQAIGSSISYGKRYTAGLLLNLTSRAPGEADDDGRRAGEAVREGGFIDSEQFGALLAKIKAVNADTVRFLAYFKIEALADLPANRFAEAMAALNRKTRK